MANFQTKWVDKLPAVGTECPVCQKGDLFSGKYGGVLCYACKTAWKINKYPQNQKSGDNEEILNALRLVDAEVKGLRDDFIAFTAIFSKQTEDKKEL